MAIQSKQIIKDNNLDGIIEVIHSKIEDITELPDGYGKVYSLAFASLPQQLIVGGGNNENIDIFTRLM
jgi:hypothetical protein